MPKRNAATELNHENWNVEEESEEAGSFVLADEDVLKTRVIRKAKRTIQGDGGSGAGLFSSFSFKPSGASTTSSPLNFNNSLTTAQSSCSTHSNGKEVKDHPEYLRQLKTLNENILTWIQKHVNENPYCILTPSFKDYEKHLLSMEEKYQGKNPGKQDKVSENEATTKLNKPSTAVPSCPVPASGFSFSLASQSSSAEKSEGLTKQMENKAPAFEGFKFGQSSNGCFLSSSSSGKTAPSFSFGQQSSQNAATINSQEKTNVDGDDENAPYVPPQPEVREIKEEGAIFSKRCKLFFQKDGQWVDKGVGNLHLKPVDGRFQLIIRADTNLGNILLNILLSQAMPSKKQGKNNVFIVCVPNPPLDEKTPSTDPVPMLIRVKTSEDADELLAKLEETKSAG
ncbi:hypothetical protein C0Q70_04926 [Pomacea canaliculata]|uniref:RanBD1 domain-containing protein n=1 Tax=Pomacea canaliculata TaxID=400727 RepID=A0A2T7PJS7_POMCA|nr:nuclear pore complex protein Nup50-like [Pomacea canaliculata]XP_025087855.1 nuclear pore complex protein Nup50-like [Pomacea canaliculata]XP_025087856.1 nuclear pore complex protein Nup50-like [Pomacea canaliculata]PVD33668.1 hypothetical protein C0Q70_04926 [Pomacea canaliculata]